MDVTAIFPQRIVKRKSNSKIRRNFQFLGNGRAAPTPTEIPKTKSGMKKAIKDVFDLDEDLGKRAAEMAGLTPEERAKVKKIQEARFAKLPEKERAALVAANKTTASKALAESNNNRQKALALRGSR